MNKDKLIGMVKVGEKGQIVIPKDIREMFNINTGDNLMVLADLNRGIAIVRPDEYIDIADEILRTLGKEEE